MPGNYGGARGKIAGVDDRGLGESTSSGVAHA